MPRPIRLPKPKAVTKKLDLLDAAARRLPRPLQSNGGRRRRQEGLSTAASSAGLSLQTTRMRCGGGAAMVKAASFRRKAFRDGVRRCGVPLSRLGGACALQRPTTG